LKAGSLRETLDPQIMSAVRAQMPDTSFSNENPPTD
jgi:hypothetical protein